MKKIIISLFSIITLVSCAVHHGSISMSTVDKNITYEDIAIGESHCNYFLGIGGLSRDAMILEAKKELFKNYPLKANEMYVNYTLDFKNTYYPFFSQTKVTMTADVVKHVNTTDPTPFSDKYNTMIGFKQKGSELFSVGDTVIYNTNEKGLIISFVQKGIAKLLITKNGGKSCTKNISTQKLFSEKLERNGLRAGIFTTYDNETDKNSVKILGSVKAIGESSYLFQAENKKDIIILNYK